MIFYLTLLLLLNQTQCSKILAIMTVSSHSHHTWNLVYLKALADRGHEITFMSLDEMKQPVQNIKHIFIENAYEFQSSMDFSELSDANPFYSVLSFGSWMEYMSNTIIKQTGFRKFLEIVRTEKFDLVIFDTASDAVFQLGAIDVIGKPPLIGITAFAIPSFNLEASGTPYPIADSPHTALALNENMNFVERVQNWVYYLMENFVRERHISKQDTLMRQYFGHNVRDIREILNDMNINLVNCNWASQGTFPTTPGLIPIGGLHIKENKPLPKELQLFLDESPEGVIYFSLGSNVQSTLIKEKELKILTSAFEKLAPVKVLWKWESDELPGKPENVRIQKWLPQNDVLAHPNLRVFVTHGGMLSTQEAIYMGVPIVGIPIFLDQHVNILRAVQAGYGESLRFANLSSENVFNTIKKVMENPRYKNNVKKLSGIFKDLPNKPLDTAVFWTEYAIRHKGAHHLRPASKNLYWFQKRLYDISLLFLVWICMTCFVLYKILGFCCYLIRGDQKIKKQ